MIRLNEDALICDLAETYHILDYRSLPVKLAAALSAGLRDDSRIKLLAAGSAVSQEMILLATIADRIEMFRYGFSENASKGKNPPASIVEALLGDDNKQAKGFNTPQEFEAALRRIRGE